MNSTDADVSIVIPVRNDASALRRLFDDFDGLGVTAQRIVVDGDSRDESLQIAQERADIALSAPPGRGIQLSAGIAAACGRWLWMLHADSRVDAAAWNALQNALVDAEWGRFDVRLDDPHPAFRIIERAMNTRSRWTGICTGDQGIFVRRSLLDRIGGMPQQALMEDIELTRRLRRVSAPTCIRSPLGASSRRWRERGILPTILLMWRLRLQYFLGASVDDLARAYYRGN